MPEAEELTCCGNVLNFTPRGHPATYAAYKPEQARCPKCKTVYERGQGRHTTYKWTPNGAVCTNCGGDIMVTEIRRSVHDSPIPLAGSGRVECEQVPYCPKCEGTPNSGGFITYEQVCEELSAEGARLKALGSSLN